MRILVVRNDKLGDFMLAWPAFALLKHYWPEAHLSALVPAYTAPMAELCPWLDDVVIDQQEEGILALRRRMSEGRYDALLTLFSSGRVALAGCLAGISYRLAPATKLAQFCYNHRLLQRRSRSEKPEYAYNIDLAYQLLNDLHEKECTPTSPNPEGDYLPSFLKRPLLNFSGEECTELRQQLCTQYKLPSDTQLVFIHPGSGGSANNLSAQQYATLANNLRSSRPLACVITAGPGEKQMAETITSAITRHPAITLLPHGGLPRLAHYLGLADLFISCSTGPLHIAGALNRPTAVFYPRHRSGSPLRWQTLNAPEKRLFFVPPDSANEKEVAAIDIQLATHRINHYFFPNELSDM